MIRAGSKGRYPKRGLKAVNDEDSTNESLVLRAQATAENTVARKRAKKEEKKGDVDNTERYGFDCVLGHVICMKTGQVLFKVRRSFHAIVGIWHPRRCCAQVDWDRDEDGRNYDNAAFMIDADAFLGDKKATQMLSSYLKNAVDREKDQLKKTAIREYALRPAREIRLHNVHFVVCSVYNYVLERSGRRR
jgi:hypothetical protein